MKKLIAIALLASSDGAHTRGGLLRDLIDPNCRPPPPMVWRRARASQVDFARDRYACLREAQQPMTTAVVGAGGIASVVTNDQLFGACMNARGWGLTPATAR
jgi:hypothetical protein